MSDWAELATYNAERHRGIVHTAEYDARMAAEQARFNDWHGDQPVPQEDGWTWFHLVLVVIQVVCLVGAIVLATKACMIATEPFVFYRDLR